ncbi:hypothetical protein EII12_06965 [Buchananella hordeovulneris]|uniref:pilus assembly protein TadG-related protein n=1 Tax=Buchananella hordeovulneris TaxID=52770 RepID=UPI000F5E6E65|nr:pilus assembly protein TadG-related protein [Buchananella hordeovulneris]RRD51882.1 hypothetical protein EII12_06965 [Buchananella hordeovulneris]
MRRARQARGGGARRVDGAGARLPADAGRIALLSAALLGIVLVLVFIAVAVMSVHLDRKRLQGLADLSAAFAATDSVSQPYYRDPLAQARRTISADPAAISASVATYLHAQGPTGNLHDVTLVNAHIDAAGVVTVHLRARATVPLVPGLFGVIPTEVGVEAVGRAYPRLSP